MNDCQHQSSILKVKTIIYKEIMPHLVQGLILGIEFVFLAFDEAYHHIMCFLGPTFHSFGRIGQ